MTTLPRRQFLLRTAAAIGSASFGSSTLLLGCSLGHELDLDLQALSVREFGTVRSLVGALFPETGPDLDLARVFDGFLADEPEWTRSDLKRALLLLEYGPLVFDGRCTTFSQLTPAERIAHFESWAGAAEVSRRQVTVALRKFFSVAYYDRPEAWSVVGYDGPRSFVD